MEQQRLQELIEKCLSGQATVAEQQELDDWYAAQDSGPSLDETTKTERGKEVFHHIHNRIQKRPRIGGWLIAAMVTAVVITGAALFWKKPAAAPHMISLTTGSDVKNYRLPDGSTVWLNAGSMIRFDSLFNDRQIWLQGEGFFDVTHVEGKPFEVHTGRITTRVLGTAFNIDAYDTTRAMTVFVKRGKVMVSNGRDSSGVLLPNQQVVYAQDGSFTRTNNMDADNASWTSGQLIFRDMPFSEVAKRLERRFGIQLSFKDARIGDCRITASFNHNTPLSEITEMLALTNGSIIKQESDKRWTISGKTNCNSGL